MMTLLEPLFQGEWASAGETFSDLAAPQTAIPLSHLYQDPGLLRMLLELHAQALGSDNLRPVAVSWALNYFWTLFPPFIAAASILQHRFSLQAASFTFNDDGTPACIYLARQGESIIGSPMAERYDELVWQHLQPLIEVLAQQGKVSRRLLWGNATRRLKNVMEPIILKTEGAAHCQQDQQALLFEARWPDGRINPFFAPSKQIKKVVNQQITTLDLHRECCLFYMIPHEGYCIACPLSPENRPTSSCTL